MIVTKYEDNIRYIKGVGEKRSELFGQLGVNDVGTLLRFYPRSYQDRTHPLRLCEAPFDRPCCIKATVTTDVSEIYVRSKMILYRFIATDGAENVEITLFNNKYAAARIEKGKTYLFYGRVSRTFVSCEMPSPEIYGENETSIMPIYRQTAGLSSKTVMNTVRTVLGQFVPDDPLPLSVREEYGLCGLGEALRSIHFPENSRQLAAAKRRLVFEELFFLQAGVLFQKASRAASTDIVIPGGRLSEFTRLLPFTLTEDQQTAISECLADMGSGRPMRRLVQGDVGSGKTMVAAALAYCAAGENRQTVIMAPTEVLASQHFKTFNKLFSGSRINCVLLTGSLSKSKKAAVKKQIASGDAVIVIGTHAVLQDDVIFNSLGLIVTDEQHRFGVEQRTKLLWKGEEPHMLVMSATPIPRTMSLIFYGDLDISVIRSLPGGRRPVETYLIDPGKRTRAYNYIKKHLDAGRQAYIVCPMVEESDSVDLAAATEYFEKLRAEDFHEYSVGLLHGKMKPREKESVMKDFSDGNIQLLVSTTVIEVGIDVPNAVIMLIENAERFGLSQLHQLRGRIGRGGHRSTCILLSDCAGAGGDTARRLKFICGTSDGFKIADEDLRLRGPGDFIGKRQHGLPELKIADLSEDMELFRAAGGAAKKIWSADPELCMPENRCLKAEIDKLFKTVKNYGYN